jgi:hypothetical protein
VVNFFFFLDNGLRQRIVEGLIHAGG